MAIDLQRERRIFKKAADQIHAAEDVSPAAVAGAFLAEAARRAVRAAVSPDSWMKMAKFSYEAAADEMSKERV